MVIVNSEWQDIFVNKEYDNKYKKVQTKCIVPTLLKESKQTNNF